MLPKQGFFLFCANVFLSSANLAVKELGRCCCHRAFGFPGRAGDALGPETKPRGTTANLSPLPNFLLASYQSSLLFKLQGSHSACLGVEFILNKCFVWLAVFYLYIKKKSQSLTFKIRFHRKFPLCRFSGKLQIWEHKSAWQRS